MTAPTAPLIAIVDPDESVAHLLELVLAAEGWRTVVVPSPLALGGVAAFVAALDRLDPAVVLYDLAYPYDERWDEFLRVRENGLTARRRFVLLTTDEQWTRPRVEALGSPEIISKPFDLEDVVAAVASALGRLARERE